MFKPIYAEGNASVRAAYAMNGKWRIEAFGQREASNTDDGWDTISPVLDKIEALMVLTRYRIVKTRVA